MELRSGDENINWLRIIGGSKFLRTMGPRLFNPGHFHCDAPDEAISLYILYLDIVVPVVSVFLVSASKTR